MSKIIGIQFFLLLILAQCKSPYSNQTLVQQSSKTDTINATDPITDTTLGPMDSAVISGDIYYALFKTNDTLYILDKNRDTILKEGNDSWQGFEFKDFNGDGFKDIIIQLASNASGVEDLLLFNKSTNNFIPVKNFSDFPAPLPIAGTKYYYSYHKSGCADMNWDSDLFYIRNNKAIRLGHIECIACPDEKTGIYIHKITRKKESLYQKLSIKILGNYDDYKWGFIKYYWGKNYKKFSSN